MYEDLEIFLSENRLKPYLLKCNGDKQLSIELYNFNISISKSLYPLLNYFEILLRNSCNNIFIKKINENWYLNKNLLLGNNINKGQKTVDEVEKSISKIKKRKQEKNILNYTITNGDIIANLEFGFWVNLFNANNEFKIWLPYLRHLFSNKNRKELFKQIDIIRDLRNRIFHYEPIIFDNNLEYKYNLILELIKDITKNNDKIYKYIQNLVDFIGRYNEYKTRGFIK